MQGPPAASSIRGRPFRSKGDCPSDVASNDKRFGLWLEAWHSSPSAAWVTARAPVTGQAAVWRRLCGRSGIRAETSVVDEILPDGHCVGVARAPEFDSCDPFDD